jgi:hypothetical protein
MRKRGSIDRDDSVGFGGIDRRGRFSHARKQFPRVRQYFDDPHDGELRHRE